MSKILRGEIWWADLDPAKGYKQKGTRPVLVISHDVFNERSQTVIALAVTSQEPSVGFPLVLELDAKSKLPKKSWVKMSQIRTLSTERLSKRLAKISPEQLAQIIEGLNEIIN